MILVWVAVGLAAYLALVVAVGKWLKRIRLRMEALEAQHARDEGQVLQLVQDDPPPPAPEDKPRRESNPIVGLG